MSINNNEMGHHTRDKKMSIYLQYKEGAGVFSITVMEVLPSDSTIGFCQNSYTDHTKSR